MKIVATHPSNDDHAPFAAFRAEVVGQSPLRAAITAAYRRPEAECVAPLLDLASMPPDLAEQVTALARDLVSGLRRRGRVSGVEALLREYALSSQEGVALMCLAEALLRVPDAATRDALIRDKVSTGDWRAHIGHSPSVFVNAATWGLVVTGHLVTTANETGLSSALARLIARGGEPVIRRGVDLAMSMMGEQFVLGQTIEEALRRARPMESKGFRYSYDMLGEAATTAEDASRYLADYEHAIRAIGGAGAGQDLYDGPGISIKLSALHPRYTRSKRGRVMAELLPRVRGLALLARRYGIGIAIDAEEADRLDLSLDVLEALAIDPDLSNWNGVGFVLQAYSKRCPFVIDWILDLARRSQRRLMIRLVKGAYWDTEIKRAQVEGLEGFPVFTRKVHTDVSYLACAKKLLAAPDAVFPQFATHNAQTLAAVMTMAGPAFHRGQYEFQCLYGMGEALYDQVIGADKLDRPCRIYAPVGTHETLLAYLVRRILENGANSSFVNRVADETVPLAELVIDPVQAARSISPLGMPHPRIVLPRNLYGAERVNAAGLDLCNEQSLVDLATAAEASVRHDWIAIPASRQSGFDFKPVVNPADHRDSVGRVCSTDASDVEMALAKAETSAPTWAAMSPSERTDSLERGADAIERAMPILIGLLVRESGKSFANGLAEIREAVDFLRYYSHDIVRAAAAGPMQPLGVVVCISPWNFPLAIFVGQIAAALAAGNSVLAKPAEETPLIAAEAIRILHNAGIPTDVLQLLPGSGDVGAKLVGDPRVQGVMFTGSTEVARLIQRQLAGRLGSDGGTVPLIAETGGQNAMIVDSSAMPEQVVGDVIASAFDSAGQRCSALRILCVQEEVADRVLTMLKGAMKELEIGSPDHLSVDVGPVISADAKKGIETHIEQMRNRGHDVESLSLPGATLAGTFVAPTLVEISRIADVEREVFGPVLHVLRFCRADLDDLITAINGTGYGLTFGLHTRIDETIARVIPRIEAGNIYINRNVIGAIVGVQPFGGCGLSGTGPKAGGPLYLGRLVRRSAQTRLGMPARPDPTSAVARDYLQWLLDEGHASAARHCALYLSCSPLGLETELPGPVGEKNVYSLRPRGRIAALSSTELGLLVQIGAILATGNIAIVELDNPYRATLDHLPPRVMSRISVETTFDDAEGIRAVLFEGDRDALLRLNQRVAILNGPILSVHALSASDLACGARYALEWLLEEYTISTNTSAAGGNASLMSIG